MHLTAHIYGRTCSLAERAGALRSLARAAKSATSAEMLCAILSNARALARAFREEQANLEHLALQYAEELHRALADAQEHECADVSHEEQRWISHVARQDEWAPLTHFNASRERFGHTADLSFCSHALIS